jgi:hypothetical protein
VKESDWNAFKEIKIKAIEAYCTRALEEFAEIIEDQNEHVHNRFLLISKLAKNNEKQMNLIFDYDSRSKASIQLLLIRGEGLADDQLLKKLSDDFLKETDPDRLK